MSPAYQSAVLETRATRHARIREKQIENCQICKAVLSVYAEAIGSVGSVPGLDYEKWTGGRGPQNSSYSCNIITDLCVDVEHAAKATLTPAEFNSFWQTLCDVERLVTSETVQNLEIKLGAEFFRRQLWPVRNYLSPRKVALNPHRI
jgi:hypothetical protein